MRIGIDLYNISPGEGGSGGGIWSYSYNLIKTIDEKLLVEEQSSNNEIICFTSSKINLDLKKIRIIRLPFISRNFIWRLFWVHILLPIICIYYRLDLLHKLASEIPIIPTTKIVVSILDLVAEFYTKNNVLTNQSLYRRVHDYYFKSITKHAIKYSQQIFVISRKIKNELIETYGCRSDKIRITYLAAKHSITHPKAHKKSKENRILYIAAFYPHKNHLTAVKSVEKLFDKEPSLVNNTKLYLRGHVKDLSYYNSVVEKVNSSPYKDNIVFVNYEPSATLDEIYAGSVVLNLSSYEGFGLPVIEGQSFGLPVICSDIEVFREIAEESAILVNNNDVDKIASQLCKLLMNEKYYISYSIKGMENSKHFTWERTAEIVLQTYFQNI